MHEEPCVIGDSSCLNFLSVIEEMCVTKTNGKKRKRVAPMKNHLSKVGLLLKWLEKGGFREKVCQGANEE